MKMADRQRFWEFANLSKFLDDLNWPTNPWQFTCRIQMMVIKVKLFRVKNAVVEMDKTGCQVSSSMAQQSSWQGKKRRSCNQLTCSCSCSW